MPIRTLRLRVAVALAALVMPALAADAPAPGKVVVSGTVPDEATRQALVARAREVFGNDRVVDQLGVGPLVAPPGWADQVRRLIDPKLKQVGRGQISIRGNTIDIRGEVANDALRQDVVSHLSTQAGRSYSVVPGLRVGAAGQDRLDSRLANRIVEFEPASAQLTATGRQVLDDLLPVLKELAGARFEVIGHTDAQGGRPQNIALSAARADAVKAYLVGKGVAASTIDTAGAGPDRPVASNDTPEGRAKNRRIEFRVVR